MAKHERRLCRLTTSQSRRKGGDNGSVERHARARTYRAMDRSIRDGLARLGIDPATVPALRQSAALAVELAALPPLAEADSAAVARVEENYARALVASLRPHIERFRDPATPLPDFTKESPAMLFAYVLARSPDESAPTLHPSPNNLRHGPL